MCIGAASAETRNPPGRTPAARQLLRAASCKLATLVASAPRLAAGELFADVRRGLAGVRAAGFFGSLRSFRGGVGKVLIVNWCAHCGMIENNIRTDWFYE